MARIIHLVLFIILVFVSISCEDSSVDSPETISCKLLSETDSNNYLNKYFYDGDNVDFIERYNSINAEEPYRIINYRYNGLNKLNAIDVFNNENILISTDSIYYSGLGFLKEVKRISGNGNIFQIEKYSVNTSNDITKIEVYDVEDGEEILKSTSSYIYDMAGRVVREELQLAKTNYREVINYEFDDNKNPNTYNSPLLIFKKNNVVRKEQNYFLSDGSTSSSIIEYDYEYNDEMYPLSKSEINSDKSGFINYYNYECD